jgi:uncharacterized protein YycO
MLKKKIYISFILLSFFLSCSNKQPDAKAKCSPEVKKEVKTTKVLDTAYHNGDIIFQTSYLSEQSKAIQLATHSVYSHVGMITLKNGKPFVLEAVQPVCIIPLAKWISRGKDNHYVVKRLKDEQLKEDQSVEAWIKNNLGKDYDLYFDWSNEKMYCSELVWKLYKECYGIELCELNKLKSFDLSHPFVKYMLNKRYKGKIPLEEKVVSPGNIYDSELLYEVRKN